MNKTAWVKSTFATLLIGSATLTNICISSNAQEAFTYIPSNAAKILKDPETARMLSPEAKAIISRPITIHDDAPLGSAALFVPMMFDMYKVPSLAFPYDSIMSSRNISNVNPFCSPDLSQRASEQFLNQQFNKSSLKKTLDAWSSAVESREALFMTRPDLISATTASLPKDKLEYSPIKGHEYSGELAINDVPGIPAQKDEALGISVDRKYWFQRFEADLHFSQNQVSPNWHKGGQNSLNLNTRLFYDITYQKDRVKWVNNIEYKLGIFKTPKTSKIFQISEDILRLNSNFGVKAFKNWYYTVDLGVRTQLLQNWSTDSVLVTRPFAPLNADLGLGMKYDIDKKQFRGNPFARFRFTANFAPFSAQMIYSWANDIDKGRVGLQPDQNILFRIGSSVRADLIWDFNSYITWTSRFLYVTSYKHVETEFENTLSYALTNHLSTKLNVGLRFDDSVILKEPKTFNNLIQYYELFSFGFTYKL